MREIVLDTETTGLDARNGDRVVEIGCVELINHIPTGKHFHQYLNPERPMPEEAYRIHGLSDEFLADKPKFDEVAENFSEFVGEACLIIHNAPFDMAFLNAEMEKTGRRQLQNDVIDTVQLARQVHPGARVSLDALCKHYGIDNSRRALHGALLDSEILAEVYLELIGGRQVALALSIDAERMAQPGEITNRHYPNRPQPLPPRLDERALEAHRAFIENLGEGALWQRYTGKTRDA
ncbi:MAG: DNA polymerase III subunit epsilon [Hyphomicrobiaceae bacterium]|nr:DNA polymerase III subunit epsilon [Hyphomicrobiaceae bacterium]MCC0024274.1 DNA polymerase III subunit epsilon [Hyphomicrobiaceae bacterium]